MKGSVKPRGNVSDTEATVHTPKSCHEVFKFHLGLNEHPMDFMWDWDSTTKYESTYTGHNFVFRYAKDERIVVDSVALLPTKVIDCPNLKKQINAVTVGDGEAIIDPIGRREDFLLPHMTQNHNGTFTANMNSTAALPSPSQLQGPTGRRATGAFSHSA